MKDTRRQNCAPEQKDAAAQAQRQHVNVVIQDRRGDSLVQGIAEESLMVTNAISRWDRTIFNCDVDWIDRAKFRCPRNISMNKQLVGMWRPQVGAGGVTMDGIGSFVRLTDLDLGKR